MEEQNELNEPLTDNEVEESLEDQGYTPEYGSDRWNKSLEDQFDTGEVEDESDEFYTSDAVDDGNDEPDNTLAADGVGGVVADNSPPIPEPEYIDVGGTNIPTGEAERVAKFWEWMNNNPDEAMNFVGYMTGEYELHPAGYQPAPQMPQGGYDLEKAKPIDDEDWDLLPESVQDRLRKVGELEAAIQDQNYAIEQQQNLESTRAHDQSMANVESAKAMFRDEYDLDDATLNEVVSTAARLNIVPALISESRDPIAAVKRALEISYFQSESGRDREFNRRLQQTDDTKKRQRKLSAVGGTRGNVPRGDQPSTPATKQGRRDAMVNEIAAALRGGS